ncbi:MAG TPA: COX15/CtaA family protein [Streptosporangiaceae bacterium]|nr:COX15/CtaA family protein [Streptosporangiaceae bacterium]
MPADLTPGVTGPATTGSATTGPATTGSAPTGPAPARTRARRGVRAWAAPFLFPTPTSMRRVALAGVVANAGIIMTGAAVRLSASGLGCPDWPDCTSSSLVAARTRGDPIIHTYIEFTNRMLTFAVMVVAVLVIITAWRFRPGRARRRGLIWLAAAQPLGVVAQALLGGIVVLTDLNPAAVSVHFLLSSTILALAVTLWSRCAEGSQPATRLVRADLRVLSVALVPVVALMLGAGTVVAGTGPLAGSTFVPHAGGRPSYVPRYHLPLEGVTQMHADIGWMLGTLVAVLAVCLQLTGAPRRVRRLGWLLLGLVGLQGVIGYAQYFSGLPAGLVWVHVSGSVLIWIAALRLMFATRDRGPVLPVAEPESGEPETGGLGSMGGTLTVPSKS